MRLQGMGGPVDVQSCSNGVESCENGCAGGMRDRAGRERLGQAAWPMRLQAMGPVGARSCASGLERRENKSAGARRDSGAQRKQANSLARMAIPSGIRSDGIEE